MNIEFSLPDQEGRKYIWERTLPDDFPRDNRITHSLLAEKYENISGADIKDIAFNCAILTLKNNCNCATLDIFDKAYNIVRSRYSYSQTMQPKIKKITTETVATEDDNDTDQ